mmetsp:Transcript_24590/g.56368  ORF Transcript_24590/g.56368 Transcript_24590/m.56368 type:complete len:1102 (+) Transcript_24590:60-3365(+)
MAIGLPDEVPSDIVPDRIVSSIMRGALILEGEGGDAPPEGADTRPIDLLDPPGQDGSDEVNESAGLMGDESRQDAPAAAAAAAGEVLPNQQQADDSKQRVEEKNNTRAAAAEPRVYDPPKPKENTTPKQTPPKIPSKIPTKRPAKSTDDSNGNSPKRQRVSTVAKGAKERQSVAGQPAQVSAAPDSVSPRRAKSGTGSEKGKSNAGLERKSIASGSKNEASTHTARKGPLKPMRDARIPKLSQLRETAKKIKPRIGRPKHTIRIQMSRLQLLEEVWVALMGLAAWQREKREFITFDTMLEKITPTNDVPLDIMWNFLSGSKKSGLADEQIEEISKQWRKWLESKEAIASVVFAKAHPETCAWLEREISEWDEMDDPEWKWHKAIDNAYQESYNGGQCRTEGCENKSVAIWYTKERPEDKWPLCYTCQESGFNKNEEDEESEVEVKNTHKRRSARLDRSADVGEKEDQPEAPREDAVKQVRKKEAGTHDTKKRADAASNTPAEPSEKQPAPPRWRRTMDDISSEEWFELAGIFVDQFNGSNRKEFILCSPLSRDLKYNTYTDRKLQTHVQEYIKWKKNNPKPRSKTGRLPFTDPLTTEEWQELAAIFEEKYEGTCQADFLRDKLSGGSMKFSTPKNQKIFSFELKEFRRREREREFGSKHNKEKLRGHNEKSQKDTNGTSLLQEQSDANQNRRSNISKGQKDTNGTVLLQEQSHASQTRRSNRWQLKGQQSPDGQGNDKSETSEGHNKGKAKTRATVQDRNDNGESLSQEPQEVIDRSETAVKRTSTANENVADGVDSKLDQKYRGDEESEVSGDATASLAANSTSSDVPLTGKPSGEANNNSPPFPTSGKSKQEKEGLPENSDAGEQQHAVPLESGQRVEALCTTSNLDHLTSILQAINHDLENSADFCGAVLKLLILHDFFRKTLILTERHKESSQVVEQCMSLFMKFGNVDKAGMARTMVEGGIIEPVLQAMRCHPECLEVKKKGCALLVHLRNVLSDSERSDLALHSASIMIQALNSEEMLVSEELTNNAGLILWECASDVEGRSGLIKAGTAVAVTNAMVNGASKYKEAFMALYIRMMQDHSKSLQPHISEDCPFDA